MEIVEILDDDNCLMFESVDMTKKWKVYMGQQGGDIDDELLRSFDTIEECKTFVINDLEEYYRQCPETSPLSDYEVIEQSVAQQRRNELEIYEIPKKDEEDIYDIIWLCMVDNGSCMYAKKTHSSSSE